MLIPKVKSRLEYGQTEAYVAPREDNLNSRIISTSVPQRGRRKTNLEITHLHLGSPECPQRTQLSY